MCGKCRIGQSRLATTGVARALRSEQASSVAPATDHFVDSEAVRFGVRARFAGVPRGESSLDLANDLFGDVFAGTTLCGNRHDRSMDLNLEHSGMVPETLPLALHFGLPLPIVTKSPDRLTIFRSSTNVFNVVSLRIFGRRLRVGDRNLVFDRRLRHRLVAGSRVTRVRTVGKHLDRRSIEHKDRHPLAALGVQVLANEVFARTGGPCSLRIELRLRSVNRLPRAQNLGKFRQGKRTIHALVVDAVKLQISPVAYRTGYRQKNAGDRTPLPRRDRSFCRGQELDSLE